MKSTRLSSDGMMMGTMDDGNMTMAEALVKACHMD